MEFLCEGFLKKVKEFGEMCNNPVLSIVLDNQSLEESLGQFEGSQSNNGAFDGFTATGLQGQNNEDTINS